MNFVIDILLLAVIIFSVVLGIRKGFFRSAADCLKVVAAAILASLVANPISGWMFDVFVRDGLSSRISESTQGLENTEAVTAYFDTLPEFLQSFLVSRGITASSVASSLDSTSTAIHDSIMNVLAPVFISIISFFVFILLFIIFLILLSIVVRLISGVVSLPILSQIDSILGGVFGILFAVVLVWIILGALNFVADLGGSDISVWLDDSLNKSYIGSFVYTFNPLSWLFP